MDSKLPPPADLEHTPSRIGRYRIVRKIGQGGMGAVYEAEQDNPRRTVALKVITASAMSREIVRRFEYEAQVLGLLQHPGIAQIFEADKFELNGVVQPFFAMEFVLGEPLLAYATKHELDAKQRLELMAKICDAVHHAHQRGVVHRDLKPGNILVGADGQPKVLDFGIARATDSDIRGATMHTDVGQLIGTIPYMSPEQASGDPTRIDTRSDVYSLGVVAYQLLSGRMPYELDQKMLHEAVRIVREVEPQPLSTVVRTLRGDVETIVGKALEKDVERRYSSAAELGSDIRCFLRDEPISARPPSAGYQLSKFARRNRALVASAAGIFLALVAGLIGTSIEYVEAKHNAEIADSKAHEALLSAAAAEASAQVAARKEKEALDESARANKTARFLRDILGGVDPAFARTADTTLLRRILDTTATRIETELAGQPLVEAAIRSTLGATYFAIGHYDEAHTQYARALELRAQAGEGETEDSINDRKNLGATLIRLGRGADAVQELSEAETLAIETLGPEHALVDQIRGELGTANMDLGHYDDAAKLYEASLAIRRRALGDDDELTLIASNCLGLVRIKQNRFEEAGALLTDVLARRERVSGADHPDTITAFLNLGGLYSTIGRYEDAERLYRRALDGGKSVLGAEHPLILAIQSNLAALLRKRGALDDSAAMFTEVLDVQRRTLGPNHPDTLNSESGLATVRRFQGRADDALELYQHVYDATLAAAGPDDGETLRALANLPSALVAAHRDDEAMRIREQLAVDMPRVLGPHDVDTMTLLNDLGLAYTRAKRFDDADRVLRGVYAARGESLGPDHPDTLVSAYSLGYLLREREKFDESIPYEAQMLAGWSKIHGDANEYTVRCAQSLLDSAERSSDLTPHEAHVRALVDYERRREPQVGAELGRALALLGNLLAQHNKLDEAETMLLSAWDSLDDSATTQRHAVASSLARIYESRGSAADAATWRARAGQ